MWLSKNVFVETILLYWSFKVQWLPFRSVQNCRKFDAKIIVVFKSINDAISDPFKRKMVNITSYIKKNNASISAKMQAFGRTESKI